MRVLPADEVHRACGWLELVAALRRAHAGPKPLVDRALLAQGRPGHEQHYINLAAWLPGVAMGTKMVTVMPENARAGSTPVIQASYQLFDGTDGRPVAVMDGTALTYRKTAADSALGVDLLARADARVLTMVGSGALAPYMIAAHCAVRPGIERIMIWNRTAQAARVLADRLAISLSGRRVTASDDLGAAVAQSDIVCCATSATSPIVKGAWLKDGAHIDLVGSYLPEMRESDDDVVRRARLFVDSRWFAVDNPGDIADPLRRGIIGADRIEGDLFELCSGAVRIARSDSDITLFKNGGGAHLDLFTALHVWRTAASAAKRQPA